MATMCSYDRAPVDGSSDKEAIIDGNVVTVDGLAIDWVYKHVYWTDTGTNQLSMCNFDGSKRTTIFSENLDEPRAISVLPSKGWMFWSDWGNTPKIERAGMDGSNRETIILDNVKWPNGLTLDLVAERLYWIDGNLHLIGSANFDGSDSRVMFTSSSNLRHPFNVAMFKNTLYWTDWSKNAIYQAHKADGSDTKMMSMEVAIRKPMGARVYHLDRQPDGVNHCATGTDKCSDLCVPTPQLRTDSPKTACMCPDGYSLDSAGRMCTR